MAVNEKERPCHLPIEIHSLHLTFRPWKLAETQKRKLVLEKKHPFSPIFTKIFKPAWDQNRWFRNSKFETISSYQWKFDIILRWYKVLLKFAPQPFYTQHEWLGEIPIQKKVASLFKPFIWGFPKIVVPQNGWFIMETLLKWMIWGYHHFKETPYHPITRASDSERSAAWCSPQLVYSRWKQMPHRLQHPRQWPALKHFLNTLPIKNRMEFLWKEGGKKQKSRETQLLKVP